ncbi:MAG: hypothetical protein ACLTSZ_16260 [Lachnospiraceae bacterium]
MSTQLPYVLLVAAICLTGISDRRVAGHRCVRSSWIALPVSIVLLICVLLAIRAKTGKEEI